MPKHSKELYHLERCRVSKCFEGILIDANWLKHEFKGILIKPSKNHGVLGVNETAK